MLIHSDFIHNYKKKIFFSNKIIFWGGKNVILKELNPYVDREQTGLGPWRQCKGERAERGGGGEEKEMMLMYNLEKIARFPA